jgi:arylsulfatase A-like enzyme
MFGKWHLGHESMFQPHNRGFDEFYGFYEAFTLFADSTDPGIVNARIDEFTDKHIWSKGREGTCAIRRNNEIIQEERYLTFAIAEEANAFITANKDEPFLLYVPFNAPHTPFQAPEEYVKRFAHEPNKGRAVYLAMIAALDDAVGSILETLEAHKLTENTIIWFTSDNGAATYTTVCSNEPLKGGKLSNFEGGLNVPFMVQWKGKLPANQWYDLPVSTLDIFPTSLAAIGMDLPADRIYDGVNLLPFLTRTVSETQMPHEALYWRSAYNKAIRAGRYKLIIDESEKRITLYDLQTDKEERKPIQADDIVQELLGMYKQWEQQMPAPLWPGIMDYHFHIEGTVFKFRV